MANESGAVPPGPIRNDIVLSLFIDLVEKGDLSGLGISIITGGRLITGNMISARRWMTLASEALRAAGGKPAQLAVAVDKIATGLYPSDSELEERGLDPADRIPTVFLHLEKVAIFVDGAEPMATGGPFRIDTRQIAGWCWGTIV